MGPNTYDQTPYVSYPYAQTHPDRLAVIAGLHGLSPVDVRRARVLELGCCSGGNLIPMAEQLPEATFVGIDASSRQIADGQRVIERLGLSNINLMAMDILEVGPSLGEFDYIICHGVYSWVPRNVQDKILRICSENLARNGVAYVSYNTLPGWRMRGIIRDIMLYRARGFEQPMERINRARSLVDFLAKSVPGEHNAYGMLLRRELEMLNNKDDSYLLHEHLEDHNEPLYFNEFASRAEQAGLTYLSEADFGSTDLMNAPEQVRTVIESIAADEVETQQYLDFLRNRTFRQTLLVHADAKIDRNLKPERIHAMHISSAARHEGEVGELNNGKPVKFRGPHAVTTTTNPLLKAAFLHLGTIWPRSIRFTELLAAARAKLQSGPVIVDSRESAMRDSIAEPLIRGYSTGQVNLSTVADPFALRLASAPRGSAVARIQAESGHLVTNLQHENTRLSDLDRCVLRQLDGSRSEDEILSAVVDAAMAGDVVVRSDDEVVLNRERLTPLLARSITDSLRRLADNKLIGAAT